MLPPPRLFYAPPKEAFSPPLGGGKPRPPPPIAPPLARSSGPPFEGWVFRPPLSAKPREGFSPGPFFWASHGFFLQKIFPEVWLFSSFAPQGISQFGPPGFLWAPPYYPRFVFFKGYSRPGPPGLELFGPSGPDGNPAHPPVCCRSFFRVPVNPGPEAVLQSSDSLVLGVRTVPGRLASGHLCGSPLRTRLCIWPRHRRAAPVCSESGNGCQPATFRLLADS